MKIDFYEEFPSKSGVLENLRFVERGWDSRIFLAARSVGEFKDARARAMKINDSVKCAYWPVLNDEAYWISAFSSPHELDRVFGECCDNDFYILMDLEPPRNRGMFLKNLPHYLQNRRRINRFLQRNSSRVITAQFVSSLTSPLFWLAGINPAGDFERGLMYYSSMEHPIVSGERVRQRLAELKNKKNYSIGLGTIATGILGDEPILSPDCLERDLKFVRDAGFERVTIFRLGGMNEKYAKVLRKFADSK